MTKEDKELLLKDLCARLPYGVKAYVKSWSNFKTYENIYVIKSVFPSLNEVHVQSELGSHNVILGYYDYEFKPYLFPLSNMTEEQGKELFDLFGISLLDSIGEDYIKINECTGITFLLNKGFDVETHLDKLLDWLNRNMFDWRGLIDKDLAWDATGKNIY